MTILPRNMRPLPSGCTITALAKLCLAIGLASFLPLTALSAELTFLSTRGQDIVNERGEKIMLRGVGLGNWLLPEGYMWKFGDRADRPRRIEQLVSDLIGPEDAKRFWTEFRRNYITEEDIRRIAALGYNSVRPALNARLFVSESASTPSEGLQCLDSLVRWCKGQGIYVIIDMHGAPGGQTGQNIDDSANDQPELFMESRYQDELVNLWKSLAQRYRNEPTVAGYDLLNEPLPNRTGAEGKYKDRLEPLYKRITAAIREVDPRHMIILEGADWANDWSVFSAPFDKNLVYQFHYYCWDNPAKLKGIGQYLKYRDRFNAPVWVGETGERDNTIYWATMEYFEANNIGWSFWPWKKMDADNNPYSVNRPENWGAVVTFSRGGEKPTREVSKKAFDELLVNIQLPHCSYHPSVVNAMLRRAPAKIEAENYGQQGAGASYGVNNANFRSKFYRQDEPVRIEVQESQGRRQSSQYVVLSASEWTAYTISSEKQNSYELVIRARAEEGPVEAKLFVNERSLDVKLDSKDWAEMKLGVVPLKKGANQIKWNVTRGKVDLDWVVVEEENHR